MLLAQLKKLERERVESVISFLVQLQYLFFHNHQTNEFEYAALIFSCSHTLLRNLNLSFMDHTLFCFNEGLEAEGIPHTYVVANFLTQHFIPKVSQLMDITSPLHSVIILGDGNIKCKNNTNCL